MAGGALVGYGAGYGIDLLTGGKGGRIGGILVGLAGGIWAAARDVKRFMGKTG
ncbi:hypothetical protein H5T53_02555 [Candidatus Bipolaricaulota bacterium]|nr:hypothetical protein [Candidatus Bipolaricaulota bacterium]